MKRFIVTAYEVVLTLAAISLVGLAAWASQPDGPRPVSRPEREHDAALCATCQAALKDWPAQKPREEPQGIPLRREGGPARLSEPAP